MKRTTSIVASALAASICSLAGCTAEEDLDGEFPDVGDVAAETDAEGSWTYSVGELFEPGEGCTRPDCSPRSETSTGLELPTPYDWTRRTEATTCGNLVQRQDARTREDAVFEGTEQFGSTEGTCLYDDDGDRIGTVKYGTVALCVHENQRNGVDSYRTEVTTFRRGVGRGDIRLHLKGVPKIAGGDCRVDWRVVYGDE